jgi:hypothetical protein
MATRTIDRARGSWLRRLLVATALAAAALWGLRPARAFPVDWFPWSWWELYCSAWGCEDIIYPPKVQPPMPPGAPPTEGPPGPGMPGGPKLPGPKPGIPWPRIGNLCAGGIVVAVDIGIVYCIFNYPPDGSPPWGGYSPPSGGPPQCEADGACPEPPKPPAYPPGSQPVDGWCTSDQDCEPGLACVLNSSGKGQCFQPG